MKKSFVLISTLMLVVLLGIFSISIVETNMYNANLNKLKYLHLQGQIHMRNIKQFILTHNKQEIEALKLSDNRYNLEVNITTLNNKNTYNISICTKDDTPICLKESIPIHI